MFVTRTGVRLRHKARWREAEAGDIERSISLREWPRYLDLTSSQPLANLGRSLGLSVSGPNLSKSIYQPNNLTAKTARWALFIDFQSGYHNTLSRDRRKMSQQTPDYDLLWLRL